ncbi:XdhC family protein [Nocardia goodfellowii]|uniref:Xanthine dehydrogenase accessory factor n=1 Tax=Nocardia goodfellowii TaxID=882446 RepID=A0ABS4QJQ9_9NOCA|nr:XdhC family protein [Nocardia goodfellowii]MBP2191303.1 xanthine dehydrogenase accessory factor [Nocardia goodfellowii]
MRDIAHQLLEWHCGGVEYALATVIGTSGSAPRPPGAAMAVSADGRVAGSVSGGCVEAAVHQLCLEALDSGRAVRQRFGYSDDDAFAVGLTCGGEVEIFVHPAPGAALEPALSALTRGEPVTVVRSLGSAVRTTVIPGEPMSETGLRTAEFMECYSSPPRLLIFGAIDYAAALAAMGRFLGYRVTVCDARPVFTTADRFPEAHEVVVDWPDRYLRSLTVDARTVVCVLTHDAKFDLPLLEVALRLPVGYVGAMGSRRTHAERLRLLRESGLTDRELARLRSPIGLDLGGRTPAETAVSIAAEIIAEVRGGTAAPLVLTGGAIHR